VAAIVQVERDVNVRRADTGFWKPSLETSIYLSNRTVAAEIAANAIRKYCGIENKSHYTRDVTFREDASRIRTNPGIFARLRTITYNVLLQPVGNDASRPVRCGARRHRRRAGNGPQ
jgi:predicted transposase YbfD/YdcC